MAAIDHRGRPVDSPGGVQLAQQFAMQTLPDAGCLPRCKAPVCGRWRTSHLSWKMAPGDPCEQDEHDRVETDTVIHARTVTARIRRMIREQWLGLHFPFARLP